MKRSLSLPVAAVGAVVLGVAGFGAGFVVRATNDDAQPAPQSANSGVAPSASGSNGGWSNFPGSDQPGRDIKVAADGGTTNSGYGEADASIMPACNFDLPAAITASGVDLAAANFAVRPLGSAFVPSSFSVRAVGDCSYNDDGTPVDPGTGKIFVDTMWRHVDTGIQVSITQQVADGKLANVIRQNQASFTDGGYSFNVYVNNWYYYAGVKDAIEPALSSREPAGILPGAPDPRIAEVLNAVVKDLAPGFNDQCFAHEVQGDWDDLATFGLGDPRSAIPSGAELQNMSFVYIEEAVTDCGGAPLTADGGIQFSANWYSNDKSGTNVSIYAGGMGPDQGQIWNLGQINEYSANWQSHNIAFNVYGSTGGNSGLGTDAIRAIAKAIDPSFDEACFITETSFRRGDLGQFGLNAPVLPNGYEIREERGVSFDIRDDCDTPEGYVDNGMSYWSNYGDDNGNTISIGMDRSPYGKGEVGTGYVAPGSIYFVSADGIMVSVSGYNGTGGEGPSLDVLKAIGLSIDPISRLRLP